MLRRGALLIVLTAFFTAGCSIDRIEWESTGFPVEEVRHSLEEEQRAKDPQVECIKRESGGSVWECRAHAGAVEFECKVNVGPREAIRKLECEQKDAEVAPPEE